MLLKDFLAFAAFYFILKAIILFVHLELRRNHVHVPTAVTGLFS